MLMFMTSHHSRGAWVAAVVLVATAIIAAASHRSAATDNNAEALAAADVSFTILRDASSRRPLPLGLHLTGRKLDEKVGLHLALSASGEDIYVWENVQREYCMLVAAAKPQGRTDFLALCAGAEKLATRGALMASRPLPNGSHHVICALPDLVAARVAGRSVDLPAKNNVVVVDISDGDTLLVSTRFGTKQFTVEGPPEAIPPQLPPFPKGWSLASDGKAGWATFSSGGDFSLKWHNGAAGHEIH